ncbi:MAG: hypothetical protein ABWX65_13275 [Mycetocola sp.]
MGTEPESTTPDEPPKDEMDSSAIGVGIALGVSIGTGLSLVLDNWAFAGIGIAIGVAVGVAISQKTVRENGAANPETEPPASDGDRP